MFAGTWTATRVLQVTEEEWRQGSAQVLCTGLDYLVIAGTWSFERASDTRQLLKA